MQEKKLSYCLGFVPNVYKSIVKTDLKNILGITSDRNLLRVIKGQIQPKYDKGVMIENYFKLNYPQIGNNWKLKF